MNRHNYASLTDLIHHLESSPGLNEDNKEGTELVLVPQDFACFQPESNSNGRNTASSSSSNIDLLDRLGKAAELNSRNIRRLCFTVSNAERDSIYIRPLVHGLRDADSVTFRFPSGGWLALDCLRHADHVKRLSIDFCAVIPINEDLDFVLWHVLMKSLSSHPSLEIIEIIGYHSDTLDPILVTIATIPSLREFRVEGRVRLDRSSYSKLSHEKLIAFLSLPALSTLSLTGVNIHNNCLCQTWAKGLATSRITFFELVSCHFPEQLISEVADAVRANPSITTVKVSHYHVAPSPSATNDTQTMVPLASAVAGCLKYCPQWTMLGLEGTPLDEASCESLAIGLGNGCSLQCLSLQDCVTSSRDLIAIMTGLRSNRGLCKLSLTTPLLMTAWDRGLQDFVRNNTNLKHISLFACKLSLHDVVQVIRSLPKNPNLESLDLGGNALSFADKITIIRNINSTTTIRKLFISDYHRHQISVAEAMDLTAAFAGNLTIENINLGGVLCRNSETHCYHDKILIYEQMNKLGRAYLREKAALKEISIQFLGKISNKIDCVYTHMLENPIVCLP